MWRLALRAFGFQAHKSEGVASSDALAKILARALVKARANAKIQRQKVRLLTFLKILFLF